MRLKIIQAWLKCCPNALSQVPVTVRRSKSWVKRGLINEDRSKEEQVTKWKAKDLRVMKRPAEMYEELLCSVVVSLLQERVETGRGPTGTAGERKGYIKRRWDCSPQTHFRGRKPDQEGIK